MRRKSHYYNDIDYNDHNDYKIQSNDNRISKTDTPERPAIGTRVRHIRGRWEGTVVARPEDANPGVVADVVWVSGPHGVGSNSPSAFWDGFEVLP